MNKQRGQAMVEMLVVVVMVWLLIAAVMWLQRWQQIKLQTQHHAALSAFRFSQGWELGANQPVWQPTYHEGLLSPIAHEWHANAQPLGVMSILPSFMQQAQREGLFAQSQRWRFSTVVSDSGWLPAVWAQKKPYFLSELKLSSQTSIWVGAGHALSDEDMVQRIEKSDSLWGTAVHSQRLVRGWDTRLQAVDRPWARASPQVDWLRPWQHDLPMFEYE